MIYANTRSLVFTAAPQLKDSAGALPSDDTKMETAFCGRRRPWSLGFVRIISAVGIPRRKYIGPAPRGLPFLQVTAAREVTGGNETSLPSSRRRSAAAPINSRP